MSKKVERRQSHNIPEDHKERIRLRKIQRSLRVLTQPRYTIVPIQVGLSTRYVKSWTVRPLKTGKYIPAEEDKKHREVIT